MTILRLEAARSIAKVGVLSLLHFDKQLVAESHFFFADTQSLASACGKRASSSPTACSSCGRLLCGLRQHTTLLADVTDL